MRAAFAAPLVAALAFALACGSSAPAPTPTATPDAATATATAAATATATATATPIPTEPVPTEAPTATPRETRLAVHALAPALAEFGEGADALEAHTLPLGRDGLWIAVTNGPQPFRETAAGEPVNFFHFAAVYRRLDDGTWSEPLTRLTLQGAPQRTAVELVGDGAAGPAFIAVRGHTGAHAGTLDLLRFDGERLETAISHVSARPNAGEIVDLDGDGAPEVALDDSDPYVLCYACAVEEKRERLYRLAGADWVEVALAAPPGLAPELAARAERTVALARAGLWREAATLAIAVAREAPGDDGARWLSILVNRTAAARLAHAGSPGQPLLTNVLAGEYGAALALMAAHHPSRAFALDGPLIAGTAASDEADLRELAARLLDATERALAERPDDPAILAVRALGLVIASPDDLARARAVISAAVAVGRGDPFLGNARAWLWAEERAPGLPADAPPPETLLDGPDADAFAEGRTLGAGDRGRFVRALQQRLARIPALGFEDPGRYYDVYDRATREAVLRLQVEAGLPPTGVVDGPTWEALEAARAAAEAEPPPSPARPPAPPPSKPRRAHGDAGEPVIYLTFDDGPHPTWTPRVLEVLARHGAVATFFVLGQNVNAHPEIVRRLVEAGHEAENHTFDHASLDRVDRETFIAEVRDTDRAIHEAAGERADPIACLRPPYGAVDERTHAIAAELGKTVTLWSVDPQDWRRPGAEQIAAHLLAHARPGAILLLHDGGGERSQTVAALDIALAELNARGYAFALLCA